MLIKRLLKRTFSSKNAPKTNLQRVIEKSLPYDYTQKNWKILDQYQPSLFNRLFSNLEHHTLCLKNTIGLLHQYLVGGRDLLNAREYGMLINSIEPNLLNQFLKAKDDIERAGSMLQFHPKHIKLHPSTVFKTVGEFESRGTFIYRILNAEGKHYTKTTKKSFIEYGLKDPKFGLSFQQRQHIWRKADYLEKGMLTDRLVEMMGYMEHDNDDELEMFDILNDRMTITTQMVIVRIDRPILMKGAAKELIERRGLFGCQSEVNYHLLRVEKIIVPWETHWVLTDVDNFMRDSQVDGDEIFFELPSHQRFDFLRDLKF